MFESAKQTCFDKKAFCSESTREESLIRLLKSPVIMVSGISTTL